VKIKTDFIGKFTRLLHMQSRNRPRATRQEEINAIQKGKEGIPRWQLEVGSRKLPSYSEILETHFVDIITDKRHNFDPTTSPAGSKNLHFTLNGETRKAPRGHQWLTPIRLGKTRTR
jgi:hypothetical protein